MKIKKLNKKAQGRIGKTLTWFVGFLIITFTMIILVISSTAFAGSKRITDGWDKIELENYGVEKLRIQRNLISLLNTKSELDGEEINVKDLIIKFSIDNSKKEIIQDKIKEASEKLFSELNTCYILVINTNNQNIIPEENIIRLDNINYVSNINSESSSKSNKQSLLKKGIVFPLISNNQEIKLNFYYGNCLK